MACLFTPLVLVHIFFNPYLYAPMLLFTFMPPFSSLDQAPSAASPSLCVAASLAEDLFFPVPWALSPYFDFYPLSYM